MPLWVWVPMDNSVIVKERLLVPENGEMRLSMRLGIRKLIGDNGVYPPANYTKISHLAHKYISDNRLDEDYLSFAMVLVGNEIWRNILSAVPYERRLLMLPQCLSNSEKCNAKIDEFGLLCAGCKLCPMDDLIAMAENLGYTTLVAEGTTMAIKLVEEGNVDAIIGVSCMDVLKNAYHPVTKSAIPILGIPLLYDGCKDTKVDEEWLKEEITLFHPSPSYKSITFSDKKRKVESFFDPCILKRYFDEENITEKMAIEAMVSGGQRMRPYLGVVAYNAYAEDVFPEVEEILAIVIECFHKASLVHDDIQDDDSLRYDKTTLHKKFGTPHAINVGDFLIGKGYGLISSLKIDPSQKAQIFDIVSSSHTQMSKGQGEDMELNKNPLSFSSDRILKIYSEKTGEAIKVALLTGAVLGNAKLEDIEQLSVFSELFGISYQIRDDLNEFAEEVESIGMEKYALLAALLSEHIYSKEIDTYQKVNGATMEKNVRQLIVDQGIHKLTEDILGKYIEKCYGIIHQFFNVEIKLALYRLMSKLF